MRHINISFPIIDFLYLLQLEDYHSKRYANLLPRFFWRRNLQQRDVLRWTSRVKITATLAILQIVIALVTVGWGTFLLTGSQSVTAILLSATAVISMLFIPVLVLSSNIIADPLFDVIKKTIENKAAKIIKSRNDLKIIAITGSYGKTTSKNILYELVKNNYRVQYTPGTVNTSIGIAQWIISDLQLATNLIIVEMDAYYRGEIARAAIITPPDIALITNFGDQHLEKLGSFQNLVLANLEIVQYADQRSSLIIPKDQYINAQPFIRDNNILKNVQLLLIENLAILTYNGETIESNLTSASAMINAQNALAIAELLQIPFSVVKHTLKNLILPDRRGDTKEIAGFTVLDKSYNISESTAKASVVEAYSLAANSGKDLVIITAGIPERGQESIRVNKEYGRFLSGYAKHIIILQSIYAPAIQDGITNPGSIYKATTMSEALELLIQKNKPELHIVLMQPELTDLSY